MEASNSINQEKRGRDYILTEGMGSSIESLLKKIRVDKEHPADYFTRFSQYAEMFGELYDYAGPGVFMPGSETYVPLQNCMPLYEILDKKREKGELLPEQKKDLIVLTQLKQNEEHINKILADIEKVTIKLWIGAYNAHLAGENPEKVVALYNEQFKEMYIMERAPQKTIRNPIKPAVKPADYKPAAKLEQRVSTAEPTTLPEPIEGLEQPVKPYQPVPAQETPKSIPKEADFDDKELDEELGPTARDPFHLKVPNDALQKTLHDTILKGVEKKWMK